MEPKTKKSSGPEKGLEPGIGTKVILSNLSGVAGLSSLTLSTHASSLFLQRSFFHCSVHIVENCHPLPTGSIMPNTRSRGEIERIWGLEFKCWPLSITLGFFFCDSKFCLEFSTDDKQMLEILQGSTAL